MASTWYAAVSSSQTLSPAAPPKPSSPKLSERSRASAIDDESCVSMLLWEVLAAACVHCMYNGENAYHLQSDHIELITPGLLMAVQIL